MTNSKPLTPLEKLTAEKTRIRLLVNEQEIKMNEHITYAQANAGSLFLSFLSSMLFTQSDRKASQAETNSPDGSTPASTPSSTPFSFADLLPLSKLLIPVAWDVAKPILLSWGIKRASAILAGLFTRKKV